VSSWSWSYGSWICNYICNQCLSPITLWVRISLVAKYSRHNICDKVCQWLTTGRWFSLGIPVSSTNKADRHDITEILLKVALNAIKQTLSISVFIEYNNVFPSDTQTFLSQFLPFLLYTYIRRVSYQRGNQNP
jgi:hypothetical protein